LSEGWSKYTARFVAPETTDNGRVRIGVNGSGIFWIDSASLMPADNFYGMRMDVIQAAKPLRVSLLRYPGGCFADNYHWKDGIGDRDKRPERWSIFWNEWEPNDFGFDEFMLFAKELGFDPQITMNYMSGTAEEAAQWVQYSNGAPDTPMGRMRAANGHAEPYGIKLWAVGNEVQQLCSNVYFAHNDVKQYAQRYESYRNLIHKEDPSAQVIAVGAEPGPLKWNDDLLTLLPDVPFLGVSIYTGEGERRDDFDTKIMDLDHFYRHVVAEALDFETELDAVIQSVGNHLPIDRPLIAVTEFQSYWLTEKVDEDLRLCDALYLAGVYHSLFRHSKQVGIAQIESLVNVQGVIEASQTSVKLTPEYFASLLYREHTGRTVLATRTKSPATSFDPKLPTLDAIATLSADKHTLYIAVVNRAESEEIPGDIRIQGWEPKPGSTAKVYELNGNNKVAANPFGSSENVNIRKKSVKADGTTIHYGFPAHSVTIIELSDV
jgi:alpha-N-arabinofuranosidase